MQTLCLSDCLHTELPEMDSDTMISHNMCVDVGCKMQLAKKGQLPLLKREDGCMVKDMLDAAQTNLHTRKRALVVYSFVLIQEYLFP